MIKKLVIGVDFGTDSVRSVLVDSANGNEIASSVFNYPRWNRGLYCNAAENQFRQHPLDYIEGLEFTIKEILKADPNASQEVAAISIDTTGSTPIAVNKEGTPLSLLHEFSENPNAMFVLWKDHSAIHEAAQINALSHSWKIDFTKYSGGTYSSEWVFAKILHVINVDEKVRRAAFSWVEHCDWMPALITGNTDPLKIKRSRCAAGHKAMWNEEWNGLPSEEFLSFLDPKLAGLRNRLYQKTATSDIPVGTLSQEWADKLGLNRSVIVGVGAFDAHIGAVGGEIKVNYLSKIIGTSTCDMLIAPLKEIGNKLINGISGQVAGSIVPNMLGMEAGQSAFGDIYAWYRDLLMWPLKTFLTEDNPVYTEIKSKLLTELSEKASRIPFSTNDVVAIDWMNGRRTPDVNPHLKGVIGNLTLGSDAPRIFKALVESTAFGAKKIVNRFTEQGLTIEGIIALGGVAKKSPYVMQVLADVLNMPIKVVRSEHTCALGAAMFAAVVAGVYPTIEEAQSSMGKGFDTEYNPIPENVMKYPALFEKYSEIGSFIETIS
ncbi:MAG TPA: ribulokinase [Bacteroidales bacterium]|nr:ribulokinase [Bacteroidales bacterium]